jgi:hypothetical protein
MLQEAGLIRYKCGRIGIVDLQGLQGALRPPLESFLKNEFALDDRFHES